MKIKATQLCRCGHQASTHTRGVFTICDDNDTAYLEEVQNKSTAIHRCSAHCIMFELTNLDYVEYEAERRGVI